jgi:hypothetical protein
MHKARKGLLGMVAVLVLAVVVAVPAGTATYAGASGAPVAVDAKKKCKKKKKKCKKKKKQGGGGPYAQGRWFGAWTEGPAQLLFNVVGTRLYTGPFDEFFALATCQNSSGIGSPTYEDVNHIKPVEAKISNGSFVGTGTYPTGSGRFIPWKLTGQIQGTRITNGVFEVGTYPDFAGDPCSGATHFTAEFYGSYVA